MSVFTSPLTAGAPLVAVTVGFGRAAATERRNKGLAVPPPARVQALVDTGSDTTIVDPSVLRPFVAVGMEYVRIVIVNAPGLGGMGYYAEYAVELRILHPSGKPPKGSRRAGLSGGRTSDNWLRVRRPDRSGPAAGLPVHARWSG